MLYKIINNRMTALLNVIFHKNTNKYIYITYYIVICIHSFV
jgi:hypothetical protein